MSDETGLEEVSRPFATPGGQLKSSQSSDPRNASVRFPGRKLSKFEGEESANPLKGSGRFASRKVSKAAFDAKGKWKMAKLKYKMSKSPLKREMEAPTFDEQESDSPHEAPAPVTTPRNSENHGLAFEVDEDEGIAPHLRGGDRRSMTIRFAIRRGTVRLSSSRVSAINSHVSTGAGRGSRVSLSRFRPANNKPANRGVSNADRVSTTSSPAPPGSHGATRLFMTWRPWSPSPHDPRNSVVV